MADVGNAVTAPEPAQFLRGLFDAALAAVSPAGCLPAFLPVPPPGRTVVMGAGQRADAFSHVRTNDGP